MFQTTRFALGASALAVLMACASAPDRRADATAPPLSIECPDVTRLHAAQLYGSWELELPQAGQRGQRGQLTLRQHPEYSASLRGEIRYGGQRSIASGDVEDGEFNLDESRDGKTLHAFWSGKLVPSACGAEIRGTWQPLAQPGQAPRPASEFILRRAAASSSSQ